MVVDTDLDCLSVIQFASDVLKINHIIVCGRYEYSDIQAAMGDHEHGLIDNWLWHTKDVDRYYADELYDLEGDEIFNR